MPDDPPPSSNEDSPVFRVGQPRETLFERQIREAMEQGAFDNLPHQGKPLPNDDNPLAGDWGLAFKILKDAGFAPPWVEADKEVRQLLERRDALHARARSGTLSALARRRDREQLERLVRDINAAIARLNSEAPSYRQHRSPLLIADELAAYDAAGDGAS